MKTISEVLEGINLLIVEVPWGITMITTAITIVSIVAIVMIVICAIPQDRSNGKKVHRD